MSEPKVKRVDYTVSPLISPLACGLNNAQGYATPPKGQSQEDSELGHDAGYLGVQHDHVRSVISLSTSFAYPS